MNEGTTGTLTRDLRALRPGDADSFRRFYQAHFDTVYFYILSVARRHQDAEEAAQELFTALYHQSDKFSGADRPLEYLYRSARNAALRQLRRRGNERLGEAMDAALLLPDERVDREQRDHDEIAALKEQFATLPDEQREVLILKLFQDLTFEEIALFTDTPLQTVASRYRYALNKLKEKWRHDD